MVCRGLILKIFITLFLVPLATAAQAAPIWPGQNDWSWAWEVKFADWLKGRATEPDYFYKEKIQIDCADAVYAYRWIFARENDLKMAVHSHNGIFTNESESSEWSHLPTANHWRNDARFLRSLDWMLRNTFTKSLAKESYPVAITADALIAGAFYLDIEVNHHAQIIATTEYNDPSQLPFGFLVATVPRELQKMKFVRYWSSKQQTDGLSGFRRFTWPRKVNGSWTFERATNMPHYSTEQYDRNFIKNSELTFTAAIYDSVKPNMNPRAKVYLGLTEALKYVRERIKIVNEGYAFCTRNIKCADPKSQDYDDWSTPSRDRRIGELFYELDMDVARFSRGDIEITNYWQDTLPKVLVFQNSLDEISLLQIYLIWKDSLYSSEPAAIPDVRWGFNKFDRRQLPPVNQYYDEVPHFD